MEDNRMFRRMLDAARQRLAGRNPHEIARNAGVIFDEAASEFCIVTLGRSLNLPFPGLELPPDMQNWHGLLVLHYLDLADGAPLQGKSITFGQMKDGMVRGGGLDRRCEEAISTLMERISPQELGERCQRLGGRIVESNADFAAELALLPRFVLVLKVWFADEDFGASGRMLTDASADHYLTIEDAVTAGEVLLEMLSGT